MASPRPLQVLGGFFGDILEQSPGARCFFRYMLISQGLPVWYSTQWHCFFVRLLVVFSFLV